MKNKKGVAIPLLLIVALSTIGIAHALWSETLNIEGTIETGYIDMRKVCISPFLFLS